MRLALKLRRTLRLATIGIMVTGVWLHPLQPRAQSSSPAAGPAFDVTSVKPNHSGDGRMMMMPLPGGRISLTNVPLKMMIRTAYGLQPFQIVGGPDWMANTARFDVMAKAEGNPTLDQLQLMLRALLADRFRLAVHRETRELPIYALVMARADAKSGARLKKSAADCLKASGSTPPPPPSGTTPSSQTPECGFNMSPGTLSARNVTMVALAQTLAGVVGRVVVDRTDVAGGFDLDLTWTPDQGGGVDPPPTPIDANSPSLFTSLQEQLGLKLESTKGPVEMLVIDRAELPTAD